MASRLRVQLASPRSDRPQWVAVGAVAVGGLVAGLLLTAALGRSLRASNAEPENEPTVGAEPRAPQSEPVQPALEQAARRTKAKKRAAPGVPAAEPESTAAIGDGAAGQPVDAAVAAAAGTAAPPAGTPPAEMPPVAVAEASAAVAPTSSTRELVHGNIAYLRCEGVPLEPGPFPCPRDKRFEHKVWDALEALTHCPLPAEGSGDIELRIEFRTRGRRSFEVRPANESAPFASAASACLAAGLEPIRTQLHPIFMTVAFRFELR